MENVATFYAIGDVHGRLDMLTRLLAEIETHAADKAGPKLVVFLGDYVDRGPQSKEVVALLRSGKATSLAYICLKGNHEDMMAATVLRGEYPDHWTSNGGAATLESYAGDDDGR